VQTLAEEVREKQKYEVGQEVKTLQRFVMILSTCATIRVTDRFQERGEEDFVVFEGTSAFHLSEENSAQEIRH